MLTVVPTETAEHTFGRRHSTAGPMALIRAKLIRLRTYRLKIDVHVACARQRQAGRALGSGAVDTSRDCHHLHNKNGPVQPGWNAPPRRR